MTRTQHRAKVMEALEDHKKKASADPEYSRRFLIGTGIYTEDGELAPEYGGPKRKE
jgi:hypothetical protein